MPDSPTGAYLSGRARIETPATGAARPSTGSSCADVTTHNLKHVSVRIPDRAL